MDAHHWTGSDDRDHEREFECCRACGAPASKPCTATCDCEDCRESTPEDRPAAAKGDDWILEDLMYASYRHQRQIAPDIDPTRWGRVFRGAAALETRYQAERAGEQLVRETFSGHGFGD